MYRLSRTAIAAAIFAMAFPAAHAFGARETASPAAESVDWTVGIASLSRTDDSPSLAVLADLVGGRLARSVSEVGSRERTEEELAIMLKARSTEKLRLAGKNLSAKRAARDALFFQGYPGWKYGKELSKADGSVAAAVKELSAIREKPPAFLAASKIALSKDNEDGRFLTAVAEGKESETCSAKKLDVLLYGSIEPFYGRHLVSLSLYDDGLGSVVFRDESVFSPENREEALNELVSRLKAFVSGLQPSAFRIAVVPEDAEIVVDGKYAGKGTAAVAERKPAEDIPIELNATGYESAAAKVSFRSGELLEIEAELKPILTTTLAVAALDPDGGSGEAVEAAGASVRVGALYAGAAPLSVQVPRGPLSYFSVKDERGRTGSVVAESLADASIGVTLLEPPSAGAKPVADARKSFYGAFGRFSVALPVAFFASGIADSYEKSLPEESVSYYPSMSTSAITARTVSTVAWITAGAFLADSAYRLVRYLSASSRRATALSHGK